MKIDEIVERYITEKLELNEATDKRWDKIMTMIQDADRKGLVEDMGNKGKSHEFYIDGKIYVVRETK